MKLFCWISLLVSAASLAAVEPKAHCDDIPKVTYYSQRILRFLDHWPPPTLSLRDSRPVLIRAIRTPGEPGIIGVVKHFEVKFPLARVAELTERFEDYPKIWEDVVSVTVRSREGNQTVTDWVRRAPAFFLPRIRFRMLYTTDKMKPGRVVYRQQLIEGNSVSASDALVVLEGIGENETRISVLDFFSPDMGPFRPLIEGKIWKKSMENSFKDDIAFRARLEHPDWSLDQIGHEADRELDLHPIEEVQYTDLIHLSDGP